MSGLLVLVCGPSGAGKDTLLDAARERLHGRGDIGFARRVVTRPAEAGGEAHEPISEASFAEARDAGAFAFAWTANGHSYGIRTGELSRLDDGGRIVASVSRTVLAEARQRFAAVRVVLVTAPAEVLAARLAGRGREDEAAIRARLGRAGMTGADAPDVVIENVGSVDEGARALVEAILAPS